MDVRTLRDRPGAHRGVGILGWGSYALSLGLTNGRLFKRVLGFSPGFAAPPELNGKPRIFVSHGTKDGVLPIDSCSRRIVKKLEHSDYAVEYREFTGSHTLPADIASAAFSWLAS